MQYIKKLFSNNRKGAGGFDKILLADVFALLVFGLVMISSASVVLSYNNFGNNNYYITHQITKGILPGIILMLFLARTDYRILKKYSSYLLPLVMFALLIVFVPGIGLDAKGASRWIVLFGMSFQPSEIAKLIFLVYLAAWMEKRKAKLNDFHEGFLPLMMILFLIAIPILKQPDFDTLIVMSALTFIMYFVAGASWNYILIMIAGGVAAFLLLIKLAPYRMNRLMVFLHPELDPQGIGYQINQSLLALGSGGLLGLGLGHSRQKFNYLPEPMGDSIFAVTGEELGLVGLLVAIFLFAVFASRGIRIAQRTGDSFGKFLAIGTTSFIVLQAMMNMGAITSLIPLTGTPLPFISYGGSSVLVSLMAVGILLSVSKFGSSVKK